MDKIQSTAVASPLPAWDPRFAGEDPHLAPQPVHLATAPPFERAEVRCLVIGGHTLNLLGLRSLLETSIAGASVCATRTVDQGLEVIARQLGAPFSLVVADLCDSDIAAVAIQRLRAASAAGAMTMVVTHCCAPSTFARLRHLGADVVVGFDWSPEAMSTELLNALAGSTIHLVAPVTPERSLPPFTERQRDVLALLLKGYSNKVIAHHLNLSSGTVKNYIFCLMRAMSVRSRLELVARVREVDAAF